MLLTAAAALAMLQTDHWPENPSVEFSGIPQVAGTNVHIVSHNVTVELYERYASVSSTTLVKNDGPAGMASFSIPRERAGDENSGAATFMPKVTWVNQPVTMQAENSHATGSGKNTIYVGALTGKGEMKAGGSYALRVSYLVPMGKAGFDRKQNLAAYDLSSKQSIGVLMCSFKYSRGVVFRLPEPRPNLRWEVGQRGVFKKITNYDGSAGIATLSYYPGGFEDIGGGG